VTNPSGRWPSTSTPFSDVTVRVGVVMYAVSPGARLIIAEAMKLSSSLNPSNVTMATCMGSPWTPARRRSVANPPAVDCADQP